MIYWLLSVSEVRQGLRLLPQTKSYYLLFDISSYASFQCSLTRYVSRRSHPICLAKLIWVQDPPWPSKSVRRSENYQEMDMYDLYKIRLPELMNVFAKNTPVLVGVWVTNHAKCRRFVREKLLPSWKISHIVDWYWVKVTSGQAGEPIENGGLPVWSFDGPSPRRCYEGLMLGYYNMKEMETQKELPDKRAFLSVPLEHSRKPLIRGGFQFARSCFSPKRVKTTDS